MHISPSRQPVGNSDAFNVCSLLIKSIVGTEEEIGSYGVGASPPLVPQPARRVQVYLSCHLSVALDEEGQLRGQMLRGRRGRVELRIAHFLCQEAAQCS